MATIIDTAPKEVEVKESLLFILSHLDGLWPRTISTYETNGAQILVNNFEQAMKWLRAANFLDCRISAYPKYTNDYINRTGIAPTVLLADEDREHFKTTEEFESTSARTYSNFQTILGSRPTLLWSGGGHHYIQPQNAPVLEKLPKFSKFDQPSRKFLQFEERRLTDDKCDQSHWSTVSFNNCLLRIPGSINSKQIQFDEEGRIIDIPYEAKVRIVRKWDGNIPSVSRLLLLECYSYLQSEVIRDLQRRKAMEVKRRNKRDIYGRAVECIDLHNYGYVDRLLDKPLKEFRKLCIWKIFVPYFINVKKLSGLEAFNKTKCWLDKCNSVAALNFNPTPKINYAINRVGTYPPPIEDNLESVNKP